MPRLDPDPDLVERFRERFGRGLLGVSYGNGYLAGAAVSTARRHGTACAGCPTCDDLITMISVVAALHIEEPPPPEQLLGLPRLDP